MQDEGKRIFYSLMNLGRCFKRLDLPVNITKYSFMMLIIIQDSIEEQSQEESNGGVTVSWLSKAMGISPPAVTKMINALEDQGLLIRHYGNKDRRKVSILLTQKGTEMIAEAQKGIMEIMDGFAADMGKGDTEEFVRLLSKFSHILSDFQKKDILERKEILS